MSENEKLINDTEVDEVSGGALYDGYFTYTVKYGDTLAGISAYYGYTLEYIANLNNVPYPYILRVGQPLLIPKRK